MLFRSRNLSTYIQLDYSSVQFTYEKAKKGFVHLSLVSVANIGQSDESADMLCGFLKNSMVPVERILQILENIA